MCLGLTKVGSTATVSGSALIICHVTFRDCRVYIFSTTFLDIAGNLPKNSDIKAWGLYFSKALVLGGVYTEDNLLLKIGQAYTRWETCVSKSIRLAYSWKEMCVAGFTEARLEDVDLSKTQPYKYFVYMDRGTTQTAINLNTFWLQSFGGTSKREYGKYKNLYVTVPLLHYFFFLSRPEYMSRAGLLCIPAPWLNATKTNFAIIWLDSVVTTDPARLAGIPAL